MIEATCTTCGNINRVQESTLPSGAKFVTCSSCKSRVGLPSATQQDFVDLPAPKSRPPRSGPAAAAQPRAASPGVDLDFMPSEVDLPAPKPASRPPVDALPPPPGITDLPAPKAAPRTGPVAKPVTGPVPRPVTGPVPKPVTGPVGGGASQLADLPAPKPSSRPPAIPKPPSPAAAPPVPRPPPPPIINLPAPKPSHIDLPPSAMPGLSDLPAPKRPASQPVPRAGFSDLPAPAAAPAPPPASPAGELPPRRAIADLPAPKRGGLPTPRSLGDAAPPAPPVKAPPADLPAPKANAYVPDLPTPKAPIPDLLTPKLGLGDLPMPRAAAAPDLPAPKGFFDDLPQPASASAATPPSAPAGAFGGGTADLPAPKGFFDDLPQPASGSPAEVPAPKGFFEDLPQRANPNRASAQQPAEVPAPKGFFEDLPQRANPNRASAQQPAEVPAPKGFFDDLPGRTNPSKPQPPEVPAPLGFFDDLPGRTNPNRQPPEPPAPKGFFDDLPQPSRAHPPSRPPALGPEPPADLGGRASGQFDDLELSPPTAPPAAHPGFRIETPRHPASAAGVDVMPPAPAIARAFDAPLELEQPRHAPTPKLAPKRPRPVDDPTARLRRAKRRRRALIAVAAVAVLGGGGFFAYRRYAAAQERRETIAEQLAAARAAFTAKDPKRWERAAAAARSVLELDDRNGEAIGLAAEAMLADALGYGINLPGKTGQARKMLAAALEAGIASPAIDRAQALSAATARPFDSTKLDRLAAAAPKDGALALYQGWGAAFRNDAAAALPAFTRALDSEPLRLLALYGRGHAKLALGDLDGARADFAAILDASKDHIAAQVGLAAALPAARAQQQEADLVALLARKDLGTGDPRAVLQAWVIAADAARRGGRLDAARDRYRKAQALAPQDPTVLVGLAEIEMLDGKLDGAAELVDKALAIDPTDIPAQLLAADVAIRQKRFDDARAKLEALAAHKPPLGKLDRAHAGVLTGKLLEAQGQDEQAVAAFVDAAKLAGDLDLAPALTAVTKLGQLAEAATTAKQPDLAADYRARADQLIAPFVDSARQDPQLALALGLAYLQSGDAAKAEPWLRRVVEGRPNDADARYQQAKALARLERYDDAIDAFQLAMRLDERRVEIGLELARTYEASGRDAAAGQLYDRLLAGKDPTVELRARAGRFFARRGEYAKAGAQGDKISATDPTHPAGLYLRAEGALAASKPEDAAKLFRAAIDADRDPQYLDGQGRAAEAQVAATGDTKFQDVALRAYMAAAELAPQMFNPHIGQGRLYVARREAAKAIPPLLAASKLKPDDPEVTRLIGLAYKELQEKRVAIEWLARAYKLAPAAETAWHLGQLYSETNEPASAIVAYGNATRLGLAAEKATGAAFPWLTEALYKLGRIHMDSGNEREAKRAWETFVGRNPKPGAQLDEVRRELATRLQRY